MRILPESASQAATVRWDGGAGDKSWHNPLNWSADALPNPDDDVVINQEGIRVEVDRSVTVRNLFLQNRAQLSASGSGTVFLATGAAEISTASLFASAGARISFAGLTSVQVSDRYAVWQAIGAGSALDFPKLTLLAGGQEYLRELTVEALDGGSVLMPQVTQITYGPAASDIYVRCAGVGSVIDLGTLSRFADQGLGSSLSVTGGGEIAAPKLTVLNGVHLSRDAFSAIPVSQIRQVTNGGIKVLGAALDFPALIDVSGSKIELASGGTLTMPAVTAADGASFLVSAGVKLTVPAASYSVADGDVVWRVNGPDSILEFPNLTSILGSPFQYRDFTLEALDGGEVRLPNVLTIKDDQGFGTVLAIRAEGAGSRIDLPNLTRLTDTPRGSSYMAASRGGDIGAPTLTHVTGVVIGRDGASSLPVVKILEIIGGGISANGASMDFPALVDITGSRIDVSAGGRVNLANVTRADGAGFTVGGGVKLTVPVANYSAADGGDVIWKADGLGSILEFPSLTSIGGGTSQYVDLEIEASNGGAVLLPRVRRISDDHGFSTALNIRSRNLGSLVDLARLETFTDSAGSASGLFASNFGVVCLLSDAVLTGVTKSSSNDGAFAEPDEDGDGLICGDEFLLGTDPKKSDTDGDGCSDGAEVAAGTDPNNAASVCAAAAPPVITLQPMSQSVVAGAGASFVAAATGAGPLVYQWRKDGLDVPGATAASLSFASVQLTDAGSYAVAVSNGAGTTLSVAAQLTVQPSKAGVPPRITSQPRGQTVLPGDRVSFVVAAEGDAPFTFQWRKNNAEIPGATGSVFTIEKAREADQGAYSVLVSNGAGSVTSADAVLTLAAGVEGCVPAGLEALRFVGMRIRGSVGCVYRIEYAESLASDGWRPIETLVLSAPEMRWVDLDSPDHPRRFYRAVAIHPARPSDFPSGLAAYWRLDEAAGIRADSSGRGHDLADPRGVGGAADNPWGTAELSARFDKTKGQYLAAADSSDWDFGAGDFTIAHWVKFLTVPASDNMSGGGIGQRTDGNNLWAFSYYQDGVGLRFQNYDGSARTINATSNWQPQAGVWCHAMATRQAGVMVFYIDGQVIGSANAASPTINSTGELWVGRNPWAQDFFLDGLYKDVAVWRRALSSQEIAALSRVR